MEEEIINEKLLGLQNDLTMIKLKMNGHTKLLSEIKNKIEDNNKILRENNKLLKEIKTWQTQR